MMNASLIDTNIVSELIKPEPDSACRKWASTQRQFQISVITIDESFYGLHRKSYYKRMEFLEEFLAKFCKTLPVTESIARTAAKMRGAFSKQGIVRHQADMLIAATAREHGLALATRDARDFEGCDIAVVNPFKK